MEFNELDSNLSETPEGGLTPQPRNHFKKILTALTALVALMAAGVIGHSLQPAPKAPSIANPVKNTLVAKVDRSVVDITATDRYQQIVSSGTGIILSTNGYVLTNNHVIAGATSISAKIGGEGKAYSATVVGYDVAQDLAVLKLQGATSLTPAVLATRSSVQVGEPVIAIGNALALPGPPTVTRGAVTALGRSVTASDQASGSLENLQNLIQIDAPLAPGNSGGPLVNSTGGVIGMNTAAALTSGKFSNVGFAIPIARAFPIALSIIEGHRSRGVHIGPTAMLGISVTSASNLAESGFNYSSPSVAGVVVLSVLPGTPAAAANLIPGDIITSFAGTKISSPRQLADLVAASPLDHKVRIDWINTFGVARSATINLVAGPPH